MPPTANFDVAPVIRYDKEGRTIATYMPSTDTPRNRFLALLEAVDDHMGAAGADDAAIAIAPGDYTRNNGEVIRTRPDMNIIAHGVKITHTQGEGAGPTGMLCPGSRSRVYGIDIDSNAVAIGFADDDPNKHEMKDIEFFGCRFMAQSDLGWMVESGVVKSHYIFHHCEQIAPHDGYLGGTDRGGVTLYGGKVWSTGTEASSNFLFKGPIRAYGTEFDLRTENNSLGWPFDGGANEVEIVGGSILASSGEGGIASIVELFRSSVAIRVIGCPTHITTHGSAASRAEVVRLDGASPITATIDSPIRITVAGASGDLRLLSNDSSAQAHRVLLGNHPCDVFDVGSTPAGGGARVEAASGGVEIVTDNPWDATAGDRPPGYIGRSVLYFDDPDWRMAVCVDASTTTWQEVALTTPS